MYVNPFVMGIITTLLAEFALITVYVTIINHKEG